METFHSSRACLPKLCCSIAAAGLFIAGILITGAYPHSNLNNRNFNRTNAAAHETNLPSGDFTLAAKRLAVTQASNKAFYKHLDEQNGKNHTNSNQRSPFQQNLKAIAAARLEAIQANKDALYAKLDTTIAEIEDNALAKLDQVLTKLEQNAAEHTHRTRRARSPGSSATTKAETTTEWFLRKLATSPFPIKTIRAFEKALSILTHTVPKNESEYTTGNKRWKREPSVYPFQVTDLLEYEVRNKHSQNKILGEKIAKILHQNTDLSDKIAEEYQTPSEKLKRDPIMALVTRTISTYMLIKHSKNGKEKSQEENLSSWGEPFFKKKE
jgi:hypothetical protein